MAVLEEFNKIPPYDEGTLSPCSTGVEDLMMDEIPQMEHRSELKRTLSNNAEFKLDLEDNWNNILENYSEDSVLREAYEEFHSAAENNISLAKEDIQPAPTSFSNIPSPVDDDILSDFEDIEKFFSEVNTESLQNSSSHHEEENVLVKNEPSSPKECEHYEEENHDICSLLLEGGASDFPNLTTNLNEMKETCDVVTVESTDFFEQYFDLTPDCLPSTNMFLAQLMQKSGINDQELDSNIISNLNNFSSNNEGASKKRKASDEISVCSTKSPKMTENENDDIYSLCSSCVSSPEDNRIVERRRKNNIASKISRANRKTKHQLLFEREKELIEENAKLRLLVDEMAQEAEELRKILIEKLSGNV